LLLAAPEVFSTGQLAARLGKSIHTLMAWRRAGRGPKYTRITPTFVVYRLEDVEQWESEQAARDGQ
jgi:predicted DNA-binding transcriptional regulator AlpA